MFKNMTEVSNSTSMNLIRLLTMKKYQRLMFLDNLLTSNVGVVCKNAFKYKNMYVCFIIKLFNSYTSSVILYEDTTKTFIP